MSRMAIFLFPLCCFVLVACENIRFSSLFAAGDVSRGETSATQRQKFHTDDVKSVRNPVRSADWSTERLHCLSYCSRMTDKRQKATKVKCKREESLVNSQYLCHRKKIRLKKFTEANFSNPVSYLLYTY